MNYHDPDETTQSDFLEALALLERKLRDSEDPESLIIGLLEGAAEYYGLKDTHTIKADCELDIFQVMTAIESRISHYDNGDVNVNTFGGLEITCQNGVLRDEDVKSEQCYDQCH